MTTHSDELARTIASDPILSTEEHAAEVYLATVLAAELDAQTARGDLQTRTVASYAGVLGALRRVVRDERDRQRRAQTRPDRPASRLSLIKAQAQAAQQQKEASE